MSESKLPRRQPAPPKYADPLTVAMARAGRTALFLYYGVFLLTALAAEAVIGDAYGGLGSVVALIGGLACALAALRLYRPQLRAARQVMIWSTQRLLDRWSALTGDRGMPDPARAVGLLTDMQGGVAGEQELMRSRLLAGFLLATGRPGAARVVVDRSPGLPPFVRSVFLSRATFLETGDPSLAGPEAALATVPPDERIAAEVSLATERAIRMAEAGGDWVSPLAAVRGLLPARIQAPYIRGYQLQFLLPLLVLVALFVLLALLGTARLY